MGIKKALEQVEQKAFIKTSLQKEQQKISSLTSAQKVQLNRKGNELFNNGDYSKAKDLFLATGYGDGLIRLGDKALAESNPVEALKDYVAANAKTKVEPLAMSAALSIRQLLCDTKE